MSRLKEFGTKRLLTLFLPMMVVDCLVYISCAYVSAPDPVGLLERAEWFGAIGWPEVMFLRPIILLFAVAVLAWLLEKDIIFTKILVAKALLFTGTAYFSWYKYGLFSEGFETGTYVFIFIYIILFRVLNIVANIPLFLLFYKELGRKKQLIGGAVLIAVNLVAAYIWIHVIPHDWWMPILSIFR